MLSFAVFGEVPWADKGLEALQTLIFFDPEIQPDSTRFFWGLGVEQFKALGLWGGVTLMPSC